MYVQGAYENVIPTKLWSKTAKRKDCMYESVLNGIIILNWLLNEAGFVLDSLVPA
jgi:hypothetical protein